MTGCSFLNNNNKKKRDNDNNSYLQSPLCGGHSFPLQGRQVDLKVFVIWVSNSLLLLNLSVVAHPHITHRQNGTALSCRSASLLTLFIQTPDRGATGTSWTVWLYKWGCICEISVFQLILVEKGIKSKAPGLGCRTLIDVSFKVPCG